MKSRLFLLVFVALSTAGGAVFMAKNWLNAQRAALQAGQSQQVIVAAPQDQQPVLVAASDLPAGRILQEDDLEWRNWPEDSIGDDFLVFDPSEEFDKDAMLENMAGSVLRHATPGGTPMQQNRVVSPGERGFLAAVLSPGKRAVSVPVDATSGIAGFVFPGDRVDLILTFKINRGAREERQASQTVLTDVRVLAIDQATDNEEGEARVGKTATLEVAPKEGEKIALALRAGRLTMALRSLAKEEQQFGASTNQQNANDQQNPAGLDLAAAAKKAGNPWTLETDLSKLMGLNAAAPSTAGGTPKPVVTVLRGGQESQ